jgi:hypothetical protein
MASLVRELHAESAVTALPVTQPSRRHRVLRAAREITLVVLLFLAYKIGRIVADGHVSEAMANARDVWHLERLLHLPDELAVQHAILGHLSVIHAANSYYAYVHFPATAVLLIWMYVWRPEHYLWTRRTLAWLTAAALAVHLFFPLAPPRMLTDIGMVDTGHLYGPSVYGSPSTDTMANQYAAMPSLHVGWALAVAIALILATQSRWRWLWLAHPAATLFVVVATGNHYWLDAFVAVALLVIVIALLPGSGDSHGPAWLAGVRHRAMPDVPAPPVASLAARVPQPRAAVEAERAPEPHRAA